MRQTGVLMMTMMTGDPGTPENYTEEDCMGLGYSAEEVARAKELGRVE